jgi:hypothetical protein
MLALALSSYPTVAAPAPPDLATVIGNLIGDWAAKQLREHPAQTVLAILCGGIVFHGLLDGPAKQRRLR